jgi:hypothetical protein
VGGPVAGVLPMSPGGQLTTSRMPTGCRPLPGESLPPLAQCLGLNSNGPDRTGM